MEKQKQLKLHFSINNVKYKLQQTNKGYTLETSKTTVTKKLLEDILLELKDLVMQGVQQGTMHEFCEDIKVAMKAVKDCTRYIKKEMTKHDTL